MAAQKKQVKKSAAGARKRREKKNIERGAAHIRSSFNNTLVTITDLQQIIVSLTESCRSCSHALGESRTSGRPAVSPETLPCWARRVSQTCTPRL